MAENASVEAKPEKPSDARARFDKAMDKAGVAAAPAQVEAKPAPQPASTKDARVAPELIWKARAAPEDKLKRERDPESGKFVATPKEGESATENKINETDAPEQSVDEVELERARYALYRSGFTKGDLSKMSDAAILDRGRKRAEVLEKDDEAHRLAKAIRLGQQAMPKRDGKQGDAPANEPAVKLPDLKALAKRQAEAFGLGDEGSSALEADYKAMLDPLYGEIGTLKRAIAEAGEAQSGALLQATRKGLLGEYPELAEPEKFEKVVDEMQVLSRSKRYEGLPDADAYTLAMKQASYLTGLRHETDDAAERRDAEADKARRRNGRSSVSERIKPIAATPLERERERFDAIADKHGL